MTVIYTQKMNKHKYVIRQSDGSNSFGHTDMKFRENGSKKK